MTATTQRSSLLKKIKSTKRRDTLATSKKVAEQARARRMDAPIILTGISQPKRIIVTPTMYNRIDVDPDYQRDAVNREVNELIATLQAGGMIPDPVSLVMRKWEPDSGGRLFIADGLQRATAFMQLDMSFNADVFEADSYAAERALFLAMNNRVAVSPNRIVKSWPGPSGALLRAVDSDPNHPMANRVQYGQGGERMSAVILVKGMIAAASGRAGDGDAKTQLARCDHWLTTDPTAKARAAMFLRVVAAIFPRGYAFSLPIQCIGLVAYEAWQGHTPEMPNPRAISLLSRVNWKAQVPSFAGRFRPILVELIRRNWKR